MLNRKFEAGWAKALQKYTHSKITFYGCKCKKKNMSGYLFSHDRINCSFLRLNDFR